MMKKKSMAVAMAAVTVAMPASQVFAAVVDNTQTEEIKAMKEKALNLMNKKFTKDANLLKNDVDDKNVFKLTLTTPGSADAEECNSYAEFERKFDKAYTKLEDGQSIKIGYEYAQKIGGQQIGFFTLEDGTIVDFEPEKYSKSDLEALPTKANPEVGEVKATELDSDGTTKYEVRLSNTSKKEGSLARYAEIKAGDFKLDFEKPMVRKDAKNDYYLDVNGDPIASVEDGDKLELSGNEVKLNGTKLGTVDEVAIDGFYVDAENADPAKTPSITKDVITKKGMQNVTLNSSELFNVAEGRVTSQGNDLVRKLKELEADLYGVDYKINITETSADKEMTIKINKTDEGSSEESKVAEIKVVRDDADKKAESYIAIKEIIKENKLNNKTVVAAGADRYETAAEVSRMKFDSLSKGTGDDAEYKSIVLVTGAQDKLVDGLTATPLAAALNNKNGAPVLLTGNDKIAKPVLDEIERLGANKVYIVGGAISEKVEKELKDVHGMEVERVDGDDRYDTSLEVAEKMVELNGAVNSVFVVGGKGEADALSAASAAVAEKAPILLTNADKLNKDVKYFLNDGKHDVADAKTYIVGGNSSVSQSVYNDVLDVQGKGNVKRLSGDNRQDTNAEVIEEFFGRGKAYEANQVVVAKSDNKGMVDALGAGLYAGINEAPVVLATNNLTEDQEDFLRDMEIEKGADNNVNKLIVGNGISSTIAKFIKNLNVK